jgi:hypothetical protein
MTQVFFELIFKAVFKNISVSKILQVCFFQLKPKRPTWLEISTACSYQTNHKQVAISGGLYSGAGRLICFSFARELQRLPITK